ncbi:hypothetical protein DZC73_04280 [Albitalea terrae]|uniref:Uncharacterized protein n=2 Tax=Piscinibacter terrae TaxID=2496871 RepID=A0A3N7HVD0_9BURK|nr:hypothetical protein DZC73_04280 [Albitalea terrae]
MAFAAPYTASTVPDAAGRAVLSEALSNYAQGAPANMDPAPTIHKNFPQIIEQNFARLNSTTSVTLVNNLTDKELASLARNYDNAVNDLGRAPRLHAVLAYRLDAPHLARLANYFGYAPIYAAIVTVAPEKAVQFDSLANRSAQALGGTRTAQGLGQYLFFTPEEIYLDFRTMPVGSLGATGAAFETGVTLSNGVGAAFFVGWTGGSALGWVLQEYCPDTYDAIGGTVSNMLDRLKDANDDLKKGQIEKSVGDLFGFQSYVYDSLGMGGDDGVTNSWHVYNNYLLSINRSKK